MKLLLFCAMALALSITTSIAFSFDADCEVGSKCVKSSGSIYGVCAGGLFPGNSNDQAPVYNPLDLDRSFGKICLFDLNCGVTKKCLKEAGSKYGVCVWSTP